MKTYVRFVSLAAMNAAQL